MIGGYLCPVQTTTLSQFEHQSYECTFALLVNDAAPPGT